MSISSEWQKKERERETTYITVIHIYMLVFFWILNLFTFSHLSAIFHLAASRASKQLAKFFSSIVQHILYPNFGSWQRAANVIGNPQTSVMATTTTKTTTAKQIVTATNKLTFTIQLLILFDCYHCIKMGGA